LFHVVNEYVPEFISNGRGFDWPIIEMEPTASTSVIITLQAVTLFMLLPTYYWDRKRLLFAVVQTYTKATLQR